MGLFNIFKKKGPNVPRETVEDDSPLAINLSGITQDQIDLMFKYGKGSNKLGKYESLPYIELPYGIVRKDLLTLQKKNLHAEAITMLLECQHDNVKLKNISQNDIISFLIWMKKEQDKLFQREKLYLSTDPDPYLLAAGVHRLDEFGALATIHTLAMNDMSKHPYIEGLPYYKVYEVMKLEKVQTEIQKAYAELTKPKPPKK